MVPVKRRSRVSISTFSVPFYLVNIDNVVSVEISIPFAKLTLTAHFTAPPLNAILRMQF